MDGQPQYQPPPPLVPGCGSPLSSSGAPNSMFLSHVLYLLE